MAQNHLVHLQLFQIQAQGALLLGQAAQDQTGGDVLGDGGGRGHAGHVHVEHQHREQVQDHIDDAGHNEVVEGALGVPLGPENGRAEVVGQGGGHAQEVDAQIDGGQVDDVRRGGHPHQQLMGHNEAEDAQEHTAHQGQEDGGMDGPADDLGPLAPQISGHHHVGAHGQAHKQGDEQVDEGGGGAHGGQRRLAGELPHHDDVGGVEQKLQHAGGH